MTIGLNPLANYCSLNAYAPLRFLNSNYIENYSN